MRKLPIVKSSFYLSLFFFTARTKTIFVENMLYKYVIIIIINNQQFIKLWETCTSIYLSWSSWIIALNASGIINKSVLGAVRTAKLKSRYEFSDAKQKLIRLVTCSREICKHL